MADQSIVADQLRVMMPEGFFIPNKSINPTPSLMVAISVLCHRLVILEPMRLLSTSSGAA